MATELDQDLAEYAEYRLDDILLLKEPERTHALRAWVNMFDPVDGGVVLLRTASGKPLTARLRGQKIYIGPKGKNVSRQLAVDLLLAYGDGGTYHNKDQRTGLWLSTYSSATKLEREHYDEQGVEFQTEYLTHILKQADEESEDLAAE